MLPLSSKVAPSGGPREKAELEEWVDFQWVKNGRHFRQRLQPGQRCGGLRRWRVRRGGGRFPQRDCGWSHLERA